MLKTAYGVFAYNEQEHITQCIESIRCQDPKSNIYVLINGCKDNTEEVVKLLADDDKYIHPVIITLGDKSNAWNVFVHELAIEADLYMFLDGDCRVVKSAIENIKKHAKSSVNAIAATPKNVGRTTLKQEQEMLTNGGLAGNLYALTSHFVERIRELKIKIPVGTIGEDGFVGAMAYWDLDATNKWDLEKVKVLQNAKFDYDPLSIFSFTDLKLYFNRKKRYSLRQIQNKMITSTLKSEGYELLPDNIDQLYSQFDGTSMLKWNGIDTYFDLLAIKEIKKQAKHAS